MAKEKKEKEERRTGELPQELIVQWLDVEMRYEAISLERDAIRLKVKVWMERNGIDLAEVGDKVAEVVARYEYDSFDSKAFLKVNPEYKDKYSKHTVVESYIKLGKPKEKKTED